MPPDAVVFGGFAEERVLATLGGGERLAVDLDAALREERDESEDALFEAGGAGLACDGEEPHGVVITPMGRGFNRARCRR